MWITFILFLILGWVAFAPAPPPSRTVLMVVFIVIMVLWLLLGAGVFEQPRWFR